MTGDHRRTQAQRREETRSTVLASASLLFGQSGYEATSLEDIAAHAGLTIRPVYYYFGSKRDLFRAVREQMQERALEALSRETAIDAWEAFVTLCEDPLFRRVFLEEAPSAMGRERWSGVQHLPWTRALESVALEAGAARDAADDMCARVALAALTEAALFVAESGHQCDIRQSATQLIAALLSGSPGQDSAQAGTRPIELP